MGERRPPPDVVCSTTVGFVPLTQGEIALIDPVDVPLVEGRRWHFNQGYAGTWIDGKRRSMHQLLLDCAQVDHANGDGLDNRRSNLRPATTSQNLGNQRRPRGPKTSRFKGVSRAGDKWLATIQVLGRSRNLGRYDDEAEAARAYDRAAEDAWGEFAATNVRLGRLGGE